MNRKEFSTSSSVTSKQTPTTCTVGYYGLGREEYLKKCDYFDSDEYKEKEKARMATQQQPVDSKWICVETKLPDMYVNVLVWEDGYVGIGWRSAHGKNYFYHDEGSYHSVTHWMPLPE